MLDGTETLQARALHKLRRFNVDLRGFDVTSVRVNGKASAFTRRGEQELEITPATPLITGHAFTARVSYKGVPQTVIDPDGSSEGWVKTPDGVRRRRAAGLTGLVPGQRRPERQGDLRHRRRRPGGKDRAGQHPRRGQRHRS